MQTATTKRPAKTAKKQFPAAVADNIGGIPAIAFPPLSAKTTRPRKPAAPKKKSELPFGFGCLKGQIWISDDFNDPIENPADWT